MTNNHDTWSRHRHHKSTQFSSLWFAVHASYISGTGFVWYQIPALIRTLFYSKPESGTHVTEMMTYDWSMITAYVLMHFFLVVIQLQIMNSSSTSLPAVFIFGARNFHSRRTWHEKPAPKTGTRKWSQFMALVSAACVTSISFKTKQSVFGDLVATVRDFPAAFALPFWELFLFQS